MVFLVGCEKKATNDIVKENIENQIDLDYSKIYPPVDNDLFYQKIEGKIIVPKGIKLSDRVKNIILENMESSNEYIENMGIIEYDKEWIEGAEKYGQSKKEIEAFFEKIGTPLDVYLNKNSSTANKKSPHLFIF